MFNSERRNLSHPNAPFRLDLIDIFTHTHIEEASARARDVLNNIIILCSFMSTLSKNIFRRLSLRYPRAIAGQLCSLFFRRAQAIHHWPLVHYRLSDSMHNVFFRGATSIFRRANVISLLGKDPVNSNSNILSQNLNYTLVCSLEIAITDHL